MKNFLHLMVRREFWKYFRKWRFYFLLERKRTWAWFLIKCVEVYRFRRLKYGFSPHFSIRTKYLGVLKIGSTLTLRTRSYSQKKLLLAFPCSHTEFGNLVLMHIFMSFIVTYPVRMHVLVARKTKRLSYSAMKMISN